MAVQLVLSNIMVVCLLVCLVANNIKTKKTTTTQQTNSCPEYQNSSGESSTSVVTSSAPSFTFIEYGPSGAIDTLLLADRTGTQDIAHIDPHCCMLAQLLNPIDMRGIPQSLSLFYHDVW